MIKEFKEFIMRGNVLDLAVGVIIGAAFGKIVSSFVADIMMPPLGLLMGRVNMTDLFIDLSGKGYPSLAAAKAAGGATLNYGVFLNSIVDFLLVALAIFLVVKAANKFKRQPPVVAAAPTTKDCDFCKMPIPLAARRCPNCTSTL